MQQLTPHETYYVFNDPASIGDQCCVSIIPDSSKNINPRIASTTFKDRHNTSPVGEYTVNYEYDQFGRITGKRYNPDASSLNEKTGIEYYKNTSVPETYGYYREKTVSYAGSTRKDNFYTYINNRHDYDGRGNITKATENGRSYMEITNSSSNGISTYIPEYTYTKSYGYDALNRLTSEVDTGLGINRTYHYGSNGRISSITGTNPKTFEYYGASSNTASNINNGRLKRCGTTSYTYDTYGNRITKTGASYSYTRGNLMTSATTTSNGTATYSYNGAGVRYRKVADGVTTSYYLDGDKLLGEDREYTLNGNNIKLRYRYVYDLDGVCGVRTFNGHSSSTRYYRYVKNGQGDVVAIMYGNRVYAKYRYNAWGKCTVDTYLMGLDEDIGAVNPFRWKSHYYDTETGIYYIGGRYYDPDVGLYVNANNIANAFANSLTPLGLDRNSVTCDNINNLTPYLATIYMAYALASDPEYESNRSTFPWSQLIMAIGLVLVVSVATAGVAAVAGLALGSAGLAAGTMATASASSMAASMAASAFTGGLIAGGINIASQMIFTGEINLGELAIGTAFGSLTGGLGGSSLSLGWQVGINAAAGLGSYIILNALRGEEISFRGAIGSIVLGAISGYIGGSGTMNPGSKLSAAAFWKAMAPKTYTKDFYSLLLKSSIKSFLQGSLWSIFNDFISNNLKK